MKVNPSEIPEVIGLDGKPTVSVPSVSSQSWQSPSSVSQSRSGSENVVSQSKTSSSVKQSTPTSVGQSQAAKLGEEKPEQTPQQKFDAFKAEGNELVKKVRTNVD